MKLTIILILVVIALAASLIMCYSTSKPLREKAKQDAIKAANAKRAEEEAGRERTRQDNLRREVLKVVSDAVACPNKLRGLSSPYPHNPSGFHAFANFIDRVKALSGDEDMAFWKGRVSAQATQIKDLQVQLKEIQKALRMGQPIE